jgi:ATPase family associated with various cellular activities (AAA)
MPDNDKENSVVKKTAEALKVYGWKLIEREFCLKQTIGELRSDPLNLLSVLMTPISHINKALFNKDVPFPLNLTGLFSKDLVESSKALNKLTSRPKVDSTFVEKLYTRALTGVVESEGTEETDANSLRCVLNLFKTALLHEVVKSLGEPTHIVQMVDESAFEYPCSKFIGLRELLTVERCLIFWGEDTVVKMSVLNRYDWSNGSSCRVKQAELFTKEPRDFSSYLPGITLEASSAIRKLGRLTKKYHTDDFSEPVKDFTEAVLAGVDSQNRFSVIAFGDPGTGKTSWAHAFAYHHMVPRGYRVVRLDADSLLSFQPSKELSNVCLIVDEADNLVPDRALGDTNGRTEQLLKFFDATNYTSVSEDGSIPDFKVVVILTCNTTERLDPALLRKGRIDLTCEFKELFV